MSAAKGLRAIRRGFALATSKGLRRYVGVPVVLGIIVVSVLLGAALQYIDQAIAWVMPFIPDALSLVEPIIAAIFYLAGFLAAGWLVGFIAILIASPFFGDLSARAEVTEYGDGPSDATTLWQSISRSVRRELAKLRYHFPRLFIAVLVSLVVSPIAPVIWFGFGAWMMAVQFTDFAVENRALPLTATLGRLQRNRAAAFTYGAVTTLLMSIPFFNVFVLPVAVCGGAVLWRSLEPQTAHT